MQMNHLSVPVAIHTYMPIFISKCVNNQYIGKTLSKVIKYKNIYKQNSNTERMRLQDTFIMVQLMQ